ncbi:unnamed protein product [Lymnaea stagnalis]|uniref:Uncharacterized protein n=1 Tax=Lymnaea stagnalis TaxID=6523 RepID=A0AAV2HHB5_LYMST
MLEINGTLLVLLFLVIASVFSSYYDPTRVFLEPFDQNTFKKSCGNGMLAGKDYFVVKGLVNISGIEDGQLSTTKMLIANPHYWMRMDYIISGTLVRLYNTTCKDLAQIPIDTCKCTFMDNKFVRLKCNITAQLQYSRGVLTLFYEKSYWYLSLPSSPLPDIYGTPSCTARSANRAARVHSESFTALIGSALLGTAVVCLGSSIFSQG